MSRTTLLRLSIFSFVIAVAPWTASSVRADERTKPHTHETATAKTAREMANAANHLWDALTPEQRLKTGFDFKDALRHDWHFIPRPRKGLPWKEMTSDQRALAHCLLASGLSQSGYIKAETIMSLEQILNVIEAGKGPVRDSELYFFSIFGKPGSLDPMQPWGWRVEGHHLALNFTIVGDKGVAGGPTFMGTNPAEVRDGPRKGLRVLGEEEDQARNLIKSLNDDQRKKTIVMAEAPKDILTSNIREAKPLEPAGILASELTADQKADLTALIALHAERLRPELANQNLAKILKAGVDKIGFAWAGGLESGQPHYFRIQGPTFLIEYDNTQNNANHVHSVWRDFTNDFGEDLLRGHYDHAASDHGHTK